MKKSTFLLFLLFFCLFSFGQILLAQNDDQRAILIYKDESRFIQEKTNYLLEKATENQLVFNGSNAQLDSIEVGDIMVSVEPDKFHENGYLFKVINKSINGNKTVCDVAKAGITDYIIYADIYMQLVSEDQAKERQKSAVEFCLPGSTSLELNIGKNLLEEEQSPSGQSPPEKEISCLNPNRGLDVGGTLKVTSEDVCIKGEFSLNIFPVNLKYKRDIQEYFKNIRKKNEVTIISWSDFVNLNPNKVYKSSNAKNIISVASSPYLLIGFELSNTTIDFNVGGKGGRKFYVPGAAIRNFLADIPFFGKIFKKLPLDISAGIILGFDIEGGIRYKKDFDISFEVIFNSPNPEILNPSFEPSDGDWFDGNDFDVGVRFQFFVGAETVLRLFGDGGCLNAIVKADIDVDVALLPDFCVEIDAGYEVAGIVEINEIFNASFSIGDGSAFYDDSFGNCDPDVITSGPDCELDIDEDGICDEDGDGPGYNDPCFEDLPCNCDEGFYDCKWVLISEGKCDCQGTPYSDSPNNFTLNAANLEPDSVMAGESVNSQVSHVYASKDTYRASKTVLIHYLLSKDQILDQNDEVLESTLTKFNEGEPIPNNNAQLKRIDLQIPPNTTPGDYYIIYVSDFLDSHPEYDEDDNIVFAPLKVMLNEDFVPDTLDCSNAVSLTINETYSGPASSNNSSVEFYNCADFTESGPERVHTVVADYDGNLTANISNFPEEDDLDVFILGSCDPNDCLGEVEKNCATYENAVAGQTYYIVVDSDDGSGSGYDLLITNPNGNGLDCSDAVELTLNESYQGSESNENSLVKSYSCNGWIESGPERVHKVVAACDGNLTATISGFLEEDDLDVFILSSCDSNQCIGDVSSNSATISNAVAGQVYYIVVDSDKGSGSAYTLLVENNTSCPGCTDSNACNYNPDAISDDDSCKYIGDNCDDGDDNTINDVYVEDCSCAGTGSPKDCSSEDYYSNISDEICGRKLKTELFKLINDHTTISYESIWEHFGTTDIISDSSELIIWDMYMESNSAYADFVFMENRCFLPNSPTAFGTCYQREHSFPKSYWGGGTSQSNHPMHSDLFHIYPVDGKINTNPNYRSNNPYGEVDIIQEFRETPNGSFIGASDLPIPGYSDNTNNKVFEPIEKYKGDFARSYFYMATRYENRIASWKNIDSKGQYILDGTSFPGFQSDYLDMLIRWHKEDPVSQKEIDRNNAVCEIQGNRNPFIDNEDFVDRIWVDLCDEDSLQVTLETNELGIDLDGDGQIDLLQVEIMVTGGIAPYTVTNSSNNFYDAAGNLYSLEELTDLINNSQNNTILVYIFTDDQTYFITIRDSADNEVTVSSEPNQATIPTLSQWGIIILLLLFLTINSVFLIRKQHQLATSGLASSMIKLPLINWALFNKILFKTIPFILLAIIGITLFEGVFYVRNAVGAFISGLIIVYLSHFIIMSESLKKDGQS